MKRFVLHCCLADKGKFRLHEDGLYGRNLVRRSVDNNPHTRVTVLR